jgi:hypothetical protein
MTQLTKGTFTDHSIASLSGSAQLLIAADPERQVLMISNPSSANVMAVSFSPALTLTGTGSIRIPNGASPLLLDSGVPSNAIYVIGTAGQGCTCWTYP